MVAYTWCATAKAEGHTENTGTLFNKDLKLERPLHLAILTLKEICHDIQHHAGPGQVIHE